MKKIGLTLIMGLIWIISYAQEQVIYTSKYLPKPDTTWVFTPKQWNGTEKLPAIILLHGYSGSYKQWDQIMGAQQYADEYNFVIICPDGLYNSWYLNSPVKSDWQFEDFFYKEFYPDVQKRKSVDPTQIFITGLSMGGHGAMYLFSKKPELFKSAGSTSGGVNLLDGVGKWGLNELLGSHDKADAVWQNYSVMHWIENLKGNAKPFIIDCGMDDFFYESNNKLKQITDALKLNATYISQPGNHSRTYWKKSIKQQFEFFKLLTKS
ncbi:MAG: esterase [Pedobacter sp.]|jgi:putative tributyrin esterase|nr:MAG: esterase [Pedobacter sp.]